MAKKVVKKKDDLLTEDGKKVTLVTKEGFEAMKVELNGLKTVKRKEIAARIKEAISFGDLSENSEYEDSKNEQAFVEGRIIELEIKIKNVKIISETKKTKSIQFGSKVTVVNLGKKDAEDEIFVIVGSVEADPFEGKISNESPLGSALLEKCKGDTVKLIVPSGTQEYLIKKFD